MLRREFLRFGAFATLGAVSNLNGAQNLETGAKSQTKNLVREARDSEAASPALNSSARLRILVTGATSGVGFLTAKELAAKGCEVVLHGRSAKSASRARAQIIEELSKPSECSNLSSNLKTVWGDFEDLAQIKSVAAQVGEIGRLDAAIHNAGFWQTGGEMKKSADGLPAIFSVNVLAPYVLTALAPAPRLVYVASSMASGASGADAIEDWAWRKRRFSGTSAYSESKLLVTMLAFAIAARYPQIAANTVNPGWVPTKMGGAFAPDDLAQSHLTQVWLATAAQAAHVSGENFYHMQKERANPDARNSELQARLLALLENLSGVKLDVQI